MIVKAMSKGCEMRRRRLARVLLVGAIAVAFTVCLGLPVARYCRVELAIRAFEVEPSYAKASRLGNLMETHTPTQKQGERILKLLYWPEIASHAVYPVGEQPTISVAVPFNLSFGRTTMFHREYLCVEGHAPPAMNWLRVHLGAGPHVLACPVDANLPGQHKLTLHQEYLLQTSRRVPEFFSLNPVGRLLWCVLERVKLDSYLLSRPPRRYETHFEIPVAIRVAESDGPEEIHLISDPKLDNAMRAAFEWRPFPSRGDAISGVLLARKLPETVAFDCTMKLSDGREIRPYHREQRSFRAYAGQYLDIRLAFQCLTSSQTGPCSGKIVLSPSPEYAYREPSIKAIWGGTLEFPFSFVINAEPVESGKDAQGSRRE